MEDLSKFVITNEVREINKNIDNVTLQILLS